MTEQKNKSRLERFFNRALESSFAAALMFGGLEGYNAYNCLRAHKHPEMYASVEAARQIEREYFEGVKRNTERALLGLVGTSVSLLGVIGCREYRERSEKREEKEND